ncbi:hypothetical protein DEO72_LG8g1854 [Vigna unguiculata]|uniref:Uncharacterized protein n=1 Tax=Vigna unguiculata TaxID=3917 RepID=A0A4D6MQP4_VIGUN|nr:hypothetical protein DEO72_LG8g1854 [Vigna unguiculata]
MAKREVVDTLMKFNNKIPTKGHMAQVGKKNLNLSQALRKEKAAKARATWSTEDPNLQDSLVEVHVHGGSKRKAEVPVKQGRGKDVKKWKLDSELPETPARSDIDINVSEALVNSIDKETNMLRRRWPGRRKGRSEADYDELKEKHDGLKTKLEDLRGCIIQEHINGFQKGLRQAAYFHKDIDASDSKFDANKDVVDGQLISEAETSLEEEAEKMAVDPDANTDEAVVVEDVDERTT